MDTELFDIMSEVARRLVDESESMPDDIVRAVDDDFWDLLA